jgi:hypothetical protein
MSDEPKELVFLGLVPFDAVNAPTPTRTFYAELAENLIEAIDRVTAAIPGYGDETVAKDYVNRKRHVPKALVVEALSAMLVDPELQAALGAKADTIIAKRQRIEAFKPLIAHMDVALKGLKFTVAVAEAELAGEAQQIYGVGKALSHDHENSRLSMHVDKMRRVMARPRKRRGKAGQDKSDGTDQ